MTYGLETNVVQGKTVTANFLRKIEQGREKDAAEAATLFVRQKMQGEGILRRIIEPVMLSEDQLDIDENTDQPKKIIEKDILAEATLVPFYGSVGKKYFSGPKYAVYFGKIESDHYYKSKFELMTYRNDIRQLLSDSCVKALTDGEDGAWFDRWEELVALTGQSYSLSGGLIADNVIYGPKKLLSKKIPMGKIVCTKSTYLDVLKLQQAQVGSEILARHYDEGIGNEEKLWGIPVVTTIKDYIIPDNTLWCFGRYEPTENVNFLGNFFTLQDSTVYLEQKADMIEFYAYNVPGIGIGNINAAVKITI